jgi:hypothetical protein
LTSNSSHHHPHMATKVLMSGSWGHSQHDGKTRVHMWSVGQQVTVQSRTWPGCVRFWFLVS